ncbi:MAG TPA: nuclear transport factor 2 family protein [Pyrinomonadaceae bacterium]|nr:nuclear transport factor 2 family protein [Pyrinomonadaceae bacterium]
MSTQIPPDKISRAVRAYFLAIRAMDAEAWANTFAEDGTTFDPVGTPAITGRDALREFLQSICKNFKSVGLTEDSVFVAGNGAAVKWTGHGISSNGKEVKFEGVDVFEVNEDGKIQTVRAYWNPAEMIAQL